jgi:hypothetical protein
VALALGAVLLSPSQTVGFTTLGDTLSLSQRDVRVFNNFSNAGANNNTTPDPNWPGYVGAPLAIWKSCAEWGSEAHNLNGLGDPTQLNVGSGKANFDFSWQGLATGVGGPDDNIHSELFSAGGGTLCFIETPTGDGWRTRYYSNWSWKDGPGNVTSGFDLQGLATKMHGHALGLGHSTVAGATMANNPVALGVQERSIAADDKAGVKFLYGPIDTGVKPHISHLTLASGVLYIAGTNFDVVPQNEVWFTQAGSGGSGDPVKVLGLASNGTSIVCTVPVTAGPGDVFVRRGALPGTKSLSNAMAFDPLATCDGSVTTYCTAGTTANGCAAAISGTGLPSATAASGFVLDVTGVEGAKDGLIFFGDNGRQANSWGSGTSFQCVVPPVKRTGLQTGSGTPGACDGAFSLDFNAYLTANPAKNPGLAAIVRAQCWFRDPFNTSNQTTSLSNAVEFALCE